MKKESVPQDLSSLGKITNEICYATDDYGKYTTQPSKGWEVKTDALDTAWNEVNTRIEQARQKVLNGEASPLLFFMEKELMDVAILAGYTGFWKWQIKKHLRPAVFKKLPLEKLKRYAQIFNLSVDNFINMNVHGS